MLIRDIKRAAVKPFSKLLFRRFFRKNLGKGFVVSLSFDCDWKSDVEAIPALLTMLKENKIKASFACIGKWIERYPALHKRILKEGHEIINHSYSHPDNEFFSPNKFFDKLSYSEQFEEIEKCDALCKDILNYSPKGFRTPHFGRLHCNSVYRILEKLGYKYSSSTLLTGKKFNSLSIKEIPMMTCPEHYLPLFDSWHCYRSEYPAHNKDGEFFRLFKQAVNICKKSTSQCVFYFDPKDCINYPDFKKCAEWIKENNIPTKKCEELL